MSTSELRERVRRLVEEVSGGQAVVSDPADPREPLTGLDSLALVELVVRLECDFGMSIPAAAITPASLGSLASITTLVERTRAGVHDLLSGGAVVPPPWGTVVDVLERRAAEQPDAPFLTWLPMQGPAVVLTYGELERRSRALAGRLPVGERVALLAANDIPTVVTLFAVLRAGGVCLFLNPADPPHRIRSVLAAHPVAVALRSPLLAGLGDLAEPVPIDHGSPGDLGARPVADDPAFLFGTSGSTAASKLVLQSHRALLSNARGLQRHLGLGPGVTVAGGLPLHHVNGVHFTVVAVLNAGAHVVLPQQFSPLTYRAQLDEHRPEIASVVPSVLEALLATGRGWQPPESLRHFVSAAAPMTASLARRVMAAFGRRVVQGYGLTETTNFSTMLPIDLPDQDYRALILDADVPTVGVAFPGNEVEVLGRDGSPLGEGEIGEVCMRGHNVMEGYADEPGLTAEAFAGGWFHSGDLGRWHRGADGERYIVLTGRIKNVAKVRGEAVSLEEVERALCSLDGVVDAGCVAVPHALWGEELIAVIVLSGSRSVTDIRAGLATLVSPTALPRRWVELSTVPRTTTGKLRRDLLLERLDRAGGPS